MFWYFFFGTIYTLVGAVVMAQGNIKNIKKPVSKSWIYLIFFVCLILWGLSAFVWGILIYDLVSAPK